MKGESGSNLLTPLLLFIIYLFIYSSVFREVLLPQLPWAEVAMGKPACDPVQQKCSLCSLLAFQRLDASPVKLLDSSLPCRQPKREGRRMNLISRLSELRENQQKRYTPPQKVRQTATTLHMQMSLSLCSNPAKQGIVTIFHWQDRRGSQRSNNSPRGHRAS